MAPAIGVFDSGFGGLTVLRELRRVLPAANYLYFGDTAHLPYGAKSVRTVAKYAISAAHFLEEHGIEMLVVACNTATALAFDDIRAAVKVPVVGVIEPGAQRAAAISKTKKVVVAATEATVASHAYQRALEQQGLQATEKACPLFVPLVEEGWVEHPRDGRGRPHIYGSGLSRWRSRCRCAGAGLHALSVASASAAQGGASTGGNSRFCGIDCRQGGRDTGQRPRPRPLRCVTLLRNRFGGKISPSRQQVSWFPNRTH